MKSLITCLAVLFFFSSCEKIVDLDLSNNIDKLVIDANITNQPPPYEVRLTKSVRFSEKNEYPPVKNAVVTITDNAGQSDTLTYTSDGKYLTKNLQGIEGRTYFLTIKMDGKTYTAESTMPKKVELDSLTISVFKINGEDKKFIIPNYVEPNYLGNYYRFLQTLDGKFDKNYYVFNDNLNNGKSNQRPLQNNDDDFEIKSGSTVTIEMRCLSSNVYNYFFSLSQQAGGAFGSGTAPANSPNNITGDALGIFSAHTKQSKTIIVP